MSTKQQKNEHIKIHYDRGLPYNGLPDLPPSIDILSKEVLLKWGTASRALAGLNKNILRIPNPAIFVNTLALREAQNSSAIENIFTTEDELYRAVSDSVQESIADPHTKEVLRYREALWDGYQSILRKKNIDQRTILRVFQKVKNTKAGIRSPQSVVVIRRGSSEFRPGEIIYTPPRGTQLIEKKLSNMISFMNSKNNIDPLLKMAVAHYQFEAIHPFIDGNGRTGRILNLLYLINQGLLSHPVLYLSRYIIQNKQDYYHLLSGVTQRGSWKPWLLYMLNGVEETAEHTNQTIDDILLQMNETYSFAKKKLKWYSLELNQALFAQPYSRQKTVAQITKVRSRTTLAKYMSQLRELGILEAKPEGREVYYLNSDLLKILQE